MLNRQRSLAAAVLLLACGSAAFTQTTQDAMSPDTATTHSQLKQEKKAQKTQKKADKAEHKALKTRQQKKADKAQRKADKQAAKASSTQ